MINKDLFFVFERYTWVAVRYTNEWTFFEIAATTKAKKKLYSDKWKLKWMAFVLVYFFLFALNYADYSAEHANRNDNLKWAGICFYRLFACEYICFYISTSTFILCIINQKFQHGISWWLRFWTVIRYVSVFVIVGFEKKTFIETEHTHGSCPLIW